MSDSKNTEVTPPPTEQRSQGEAASFAYEPEPQKKRGSGIVKFLGVLALLLAVGLAGLFFLAYQPLATEHATQEKKAKELGDEVPRLRAENGELSAANAELERRIAELGEEHGALAAAVAEREAEIERLKAMRGQLEETLAEDIQKGDVAVRSEGDLLAVDLADQILFPSGTAELSDRGKEVLRKVAPSFLQVESRIVEVGGHTDNLQPKGEIATQYPTNWELSTARATNVARFLEEECKIPGTRLVAAGFSEYRPVALNTTSKSRRKNRRIELTLRPPPLIKAPRATKVATATKRKTTKKRKRRH